MVVFAKKGQFSCLRGDGDTLQESASRTAKDAAALMGGAVDEGVMVMRSYRGKLLTIAVIAAMAFGSAAHADAVRASNLELVTSIPGAGGTDIEFFSRMLTTYRDATGAEITSTVPVERHFALVGNQTSGAKIVDITTPTAPFVASALKNCTVGQGDPQVSRDGMLASIAYQTNGSCKTSTGKTVPKGSAIVSLADVYNPLVIGSAPEVGGSHNNTIHPSGKYLYISTSSGSYPHIPIYDISDPAAPKLIQKFSGAGGPHDIRFSADGKRAYTAGPGQNFRILNTENPAAPTIIATITAPSTIGHDVLLSPDGRFLFAGEELAGGGTAPCPGGAIYAYDMANEASPVFLGAAWAGGGPVVARQYDEAAAVTKVGGCTSHVMDLNPDGKSLTIGWYTLGTRVFSFSSFYNADGTPKSSGVIAAAWGTLGTGLVETAHIIPDNANTWSAKQYSKVPGYVFSDDLNLGLYVSKIK
jgi:WD40 repeat protein